MMTSSARTETPQDAVYFSLIIFTSLFYSVFKSNVQSVVFQWIGPSFVLKGCRFLCNMTWRQHRKHKQMVLLIYEDHGHVYWVQVHLFCVPCCLCLQVLTLSSSVSVSVSVWLCCSLEDLPWFSTYWYTREHEVVFTLTHTQTHTAQ